ncbi:unnamed protein product [Heterobilharzia americana]|nr:unnamed protein product [Heterobilharzia americana]
MSNNNSQSYVSDMHASLNATTVYHLIKNGLKEVKEKSASIQLKLEQFCGRSKSRKLEVATVLSSNSYNNESYRNHIEIIFNSNFHSMEYNNLSSFLAEFIDDLNAFLRNRFDIVQYGRSIEALYCSHMDESQCWNGSTFGRYMRKVPEFSVKGQLNNPEVKITSDELMSQIFQAKNKRKDPPKVFMNNDISSSDRKANQNKRNGENLHVRESSGMHPQFLSTDLDLPKMELYISESKPSEPYSQGEHRPEGVTSDALSDQIVVQGCFMDDEDCDLHFSDTHIDDQNNNEQYNLSSGNASHNYLLQSKENAQDDWQHGNNLTEPTQENGTNVKRLVNSTELNNATTFQLPESTASNNEKSFFVINFVCIFLSIAFRMNIKL